MTILRPTLATPTTTCNTDELCRGNNGATTTTPLQHRPRLAELASLAVQQQYYFNHPLQHRVWLVTPMSCRGVTSVDPLRRLMETVNPVVDRPRAHCHVALALHCSS